MKTNEELRNALADQYDEETLNEMVMFENPAYTSAVVGVSHENRLIYSFEKMVECLMEEDGMDEEEAIEFIEYNTVRALPYIPNHPIIMYPILDFSDLQKGGE